MDFSNQNGTNWGQPITIIHFPILMNLLHLVCLRTDCSICIFITYLFLFTIKWIYNTKHIGRKIAQKYKRFALVHKVNTHVFICYWFLFVLGSESFWSNGTTYPTTYNFHIFYQCFLHVARMFKQMCHHKRQATQYTYNLIDFFYFYESWTKYVL